MPRPPASINADAVVLCGLACVMLGACSEQSLTKTPATVSVEALKTVTQTVTAVGTPLQPIDLPRNPFYVRVLPSGTHHFATATVRQLDYLGYALASVDQTNQAHQSDIHQVGARAVVGFEQTQRTVEVGDAIAGALIIGIYPERILLQAHSGAVLTLAMRHTQH